MKLYRAFPKIPGHALFDSAIYKMPGLPGDVVKRPGVGWVFHIPYDGQFEDAPPEWLQDFMDQKKVYRTRRELMADLDTALELAESKAQQPALSELLEMDVIIRDKSFPSLLERSRSWTWRAGFRCSGSRLRVYSVPSFTLSAGIHTP